MAETLTDKLKLSKRDTGDLNWGQGANANLDALDQHVQQALLRPPRTLAATLGSGGVGANLAGNTAYFYKVTAVNVAGETTEGKVPTTAEAQVTQPATPLPVILQWETVKGATGYKVYKAIASGEEKFLASVSGESTSTYTDDGNTATNPGISVPTANSAKTSVSRIVAGTNVTISPPDGTGEVTVNASGGASVPDASATVNGIARLSTAPASPSDPIAVGDNDSRNTNARVPTTHGLAGAEHSAATVAQLNAKLSDGPVPKSSEAVLQSLADAKGDLIVGSGADAFARLAVGVTDGHVLKVNAAAAYGIEWGAAAGGAGGGYATQVVAAPTGVGATDTAAINAALSGLPAAGGKIVLREGTYVINANLSLPAAKPVWVQGQGRSTKLQGVTGLSGGFFKAPASGNLRGILLSDMLFERSTAGSYLLEASPASGQTFEDIRITRCAAMAVTILLRMIVASGGTAQNIELSYCEADGNASGICRLAWATQDSGGSLDRVFIIGNKAGNMTTSDPVLMVSGTRFLIRGNSMTSSSYTVDRGAIQTHSQGLIKSIITENYAKEHSFLSYSTSTGPLTDCAIIGNVNEAGALSAYSFDYQDYAMTGCVVSGNVFNKGIKLPTTAYGAKNIIAGNQASVITGGQAVDDIVKSVKVLTSAAGAGGTATETMTVTGLLATDTILSVTQKTMGANSLPILQYANPAANALDVTWSAAPGAGAVIVVAVLR